MSCLKDDQLSIAVAYDCLTFLACHLRGISKGETLDTVFVEVMKSKQAGEKEEG